MCKQIIRRHAATFDGGGWPHFSLLRPTAPPPILYFLTCPLKCYYDEKMFSWFSVDSDFIFGKNAPCQLLRLNFKNKSDFSNYDFSFKLSAITRFCSSRVALRELDRERRWRHLLTSLIFQCRLIDVIHTRGIITLQSFGVISTRRNGKTIPLYLSMAMTTRLWIETCVEMSWRIYVSLHKIKQKVSSINHLRGPIAISQSFIGTATVEISKSDAAMFAIKQLTVVRMLLLRITMEIMAEFPRSETIRTKQ